MNTQHENLSGNAKIINAIDKQIFSLEDYQKEEIDDLLNFHEFEPSAASERIADLLGVNYECIHDIIFKLN